MLLIVTGPSVNRAMPLIRAATAVTKAVTQGRVAPDADAGAIGYDLATAHRAAYVLAGPVAWDSSTCDGAAIPRFRSLPVRHRLTPGIWGSITKPDHFSP